MKVFLKGLYWKRNNCYKCKSSSHGSSLTFASRSLCHFICKCWGVCTLQCACTLVYNFKFVKLIISLSPQRHYEQETIDLTSNPQWYFALVICIVLILNVFSGMFYYVKRTKYDPPVCLSPQQKMVLNIKNDGKLLLLSTTFGSITSKTICI